MRKAFGAAAMGEAMVAIDMAVLVMGGGGGG